MTPIRFARASEAPELALIARTAYEPYVTQIGQPPAPMSADYATLIAEHKVWVAQGESGLLGLLVLIPKADHLLLDNVAVRPDAQGRGIGRALIDHAERHARALGFHEIRLYTNEQMTENLDYYQRRGYVETDRSEEDGFRRVFFSKQLTAPEK